MWFGFRTSEFGQFKEGIESGVQTGMHRPKYEVSLSALWSTVYSIHCIQCIQRIIDAQCLLELSIRMSTKLFIGLSIRQICLPRYFLCRRIVLDKNYFEEVSLLVVF